MVPRGALRGVLLGVDALSWASVPHHIRAALRLAVFERDGWVCQLGLAGCTIAAQEADHKLPRETHGDGLDNLQAACRSCNLRKGKPKSGVDPGHTVPRGAWWE